MFYAIGMCIADGFCVYFDDDDVDVDGLWWISTKLRSGYMVVFDI